MEPPPANSDEQAKIEAYVEKKRVLNEQAIGYKSVLYSCAIVMSVLSFLQLLITFGVPHQVDSYSYQIPSYCSVGGQVKNSSTIPCDSTQISTSSTGFDLGGRNFSPALMATFTLFLAGNSGVSQAGKNIIAVTIICLIYYVLAAMHSLFVSVAVTANIHFIANLMFMITACVLMVCGISYALALNRISENDKSEADRKRQNEFRQQRAMQQQQQQLAMVQQQQQQMMMWQQMQQMQNQTGGQIQGVPMMAMPGAASTSN